MNENPERAANPADPTDPGPDSANPTDQNDTRTIGTTTNLILSAQGLNAVQESGLALTKSLLAGTEDEELGYLGIGIHYGEVVLDGLKISLKGAQLGGTPGPQM